MEVIDWNVIPAWFVGVNLLLAGVMWNFTKKTAIRLDSRIWGNTFICIAILYLLSYLNLNNEEITLEKKVVGSRLMLVIIAFSNWFPLAVSYVRYVIKSRKFKRKVIDGLIGDIDNTDWHG